MNDDRGKLRISNTDRDEAVALLKQALDEGRLDLSEFDSRSQAVYEAKTNAELDLIFDDLPLGRAEDKAVQTAAFAPVDIEEVVNERLQERLEEQRRKRRRRVPPTLRPLIFVSFITVTIWLVADRDLYNFWPAYPIGVLTAITVAWWISDRFADD